MCPHLRAYRALPASGGPHRRRSHSLHGGRDQPGSEPAMFTMALRLDQPATGSAAPVKIEEAAESTSAPASQRRRNRHRRVREPERLYALHADHHRWQGDHQEGHRSKLPRLARASQEVVSKVGGVPRPAGATNRSCTSSRTRGSSIRRALRLCDLEKLTTFNECQYAALPKSIQLAFLLRPIRVTTLNDKSDLKVRFDLFERLNTGGVRLQPQEIRNCIFRGPFNEALKELARDPSFREAKIVGEDRLPSGLAVQALVVSCQQFSYRHGRPPNLVRLDARRGQRSPTWRQKARRPR